MPYLPRGSNHADLNHSSTSFAKTPKIHRLTGPEAKTASSLNTKSGIHAYSRIIHDENPARSKPSPAAFLLHHHLTDSFTPQIGFVPPLAPNPGNGCM
jgi:hypothetical protein